MPLIEHGGLPGETERDKFRQVCRLLGAIYHYEYFDQLERLRNDYFYFNPELDAIAALRRRDGRARLRGSDRTC